MNISSNTVYLQLMVFNFCICSYSCVKAWWWPESGVQTGYHLIKCFEKYALVVTASIDKYYTYVPILINIISYIFILIHIVPYILILINIYLYIDIDKYCTIYIYWYWLKKYSTVYIDIDKCCTIYFNIDKYCTVSIIKCWYVTSQKCHLSSNCSWLFVNLFPTVGCRHDPQHNATVSAA